MKVLQLRLIVFHSFLLSLNLHCFLPSIRDTLGRARNVIHLGVFNVPSKIGGERILRT